jgi:peptide/nickel transport system permease protein
MRSMPIPRLVALLWLFVLFLGGSLLPLVSRFDPLSIDLLHTLTHPTFEHLAGTDELGRDVLVRTLAASATSLIIAICTSVAAVSLGTTLGILAGFLGGPSGLAVSVATDFLWSVPCLVLVLLAVSVLGVTPLSLICTIAVINWVTSARIVRERVLALRSEPFLRTARAYGFGTFRIVFRQVLPNLKSLVLVLLAYGAVEVIFLESGLAFLGLGLPLPRPTWGGMIAEGLAYFSSASWLVLVPSLTLVITLYSLQTIARSYEEQTRYQLHA